MPPSPEGEIVRPADDDDRRAQHSQTAAASRTPHAFARAISKMCRQRCAHCDLRPYGPASPGEGREAEHFVNGMTTRTDSICESAQDSSQLAPRWARCHREASTQLINMMGSTSPVASREVRPEGGKGRNCALKQGELNSRNRLGHALCCLGAEERSMAHFYQQAVASAR